MQSVQLYTDTLTKYSTIFTKVLTYQLLVSNLLKLDL